MSRQIPLDLPHEPGYAAADFLNAGSNQAARALIDGWRDWPNHAGALWGPPGSGKTHLAHIWADRAGARVIDMAGFDRLDLATVADVRLALDLGATALPAALEAKLFHTLNLARETQGGLLLAARAAPARWPVALPDLASRLRALPAAEAEPPDDALFGAVLAKQLSDRRLTVDKATIAYLTARAERSFAMARALAAALDKAALARRSGVTIPLARAVLEEMERDRQDKE